MVEWCSDRIALDVGDHRETFALSDLTFWDWIFGEKPLPEDRLRYEPVGADVGWAEQT